VAAIVPHPHTAVSSREIVPGCALEVSVLRHGSEQPVAFVSLYLPLGFRGDVLSVLEATPQPSCEKVFVGGDCNLQVHDPRDEQERDDAGRLSPRHLGHLRFGPFPAHPARAAHLCFH
jgi:hypothetical protein